MRHLRPAFALTAAVICAACQSQPQPRPFAGRGGSNLDQPPRYGEPSRYVEPIAPPPGQVVVDPNAAAAAAALGIDPRTLPPGANLTPPANLPPPGTPGVDPGLAVTPPAPSYTPAPAPAPAPAAPPTTAPAPATPPPSDVPYARPVPGKPGYVFSPKDGKKVISVEGLRPGSKAKDPDTGEIFRVPYQ